MRRDKKREKEIAKERLNKLFALCDRTIESKPELAKRYAELAKKIAMRYKVKMPTEFKRRICKGCGAFLKPGVNLRVRLQGGKLIYTCLSCGTVKRYPYLKEKKMGKKQQLL